MQDFRRVTILKPGSFSFIAAADSMRNVYDHLNEQFILHQTKIGFDFIGESITQMWNLPVYFNCRTSAGLLVNRGISGDVTPTMLRRFPADVLQLRPVYTHIMGGTNNTWRLDAVEPEQQRTPEQLYNSIVSDLIAMARLARQYGIVPMIGSNLPTGPSIPCYDFHFTVHSPNRSTALRNEILHASNEALRSQASREGYIYIDYFSAMTLPDGRTLRPELSEDSLHPNTAGYDMMADTLKRTLAAHGIDL